MIYDCFPFFNELDLLEIRLRELGDYVDRFVLVESCHTFTRQGKPLHYAENRQRFKEWWKKIHHLIIPELPAYGDNWTRERYQRNLLGYGLVGCNPSDIILLTDADEIVRLSTLSAYVWEYRQCLPHGQVSQFVLDRRFFYFNVRSLKDTSSISKITTYKTLCDLGGVENTARVDMANREYIPGGGWHMSYLGGSQGIREKLNAYCHQEYNQPPFNDEQYITRMIQDGKDLFQRDNPLEILDDKNDDLPTCVHYYREKYPQHFFHPSC